MWLNKIFTNNSIALDEIEENSSSSEKSRNSGNSVIMDSSSNIYHQHTLKAMSLFPSKEEEGFSLRKALKKDESEHIDDKDQLKIVNLIKEQAMDPDNTLEDDEIIQNRLHAPVEFD